MNTAVKIFLWLFLLTGLLGTASLSYSTFQGIDPCPLVFALRACYIVLFAYFAMTIAQVIRSRKLSRPVFWSAWLIAFSFAAYGSLTEFIQGDVCPKSQPGAPLFEMPLCYVSLIFCIAIAGAWIILYERLKATR
ncbi:MAG: hypothetical protein AB8G77_06505 [Rhodothermales bacterium]